MMKLPFTNRKNRRLRINNLEISRSLNRKNFHQPQRPRIFISSVPQKNIVLSYKPLSIILIALLTIACLYLLFRSDIFVIKEIGFQRDVSANAVNLISDETMQSEVEIWKGNSLITFSTNKEMNRIADNYLMLERIIIHKHFPNKVRVVFKEREQVAVLMSAGESYILDERGYVFAKIVDGVKAPVFEMNEAITVGSWVEAQQLSFALSIVTRFKSVNLVPVRFVFIESADLLIQTKEGIDCYFSSMKNEEVQLATFELVLADAKRSGQNLKKIDVRFDRPVIIEAK